jgi:hypothetical protein
MGIVIYVSGGCIATPFYLSNVEANNANEKMWAGLP